MSRLISLIMLAILLFPLAGVVYLVMFFFQERSRRFGGGSDEETSMIIAGLTAWTFMAFYWTVLWKGSVTWNNRRIMLTAFSFLAAAVLGGLFGAFCGPIDDEFAVFVGSVSAPLLWQVATILIWRETEPERAARLAVATGRSSVVCPSCSYNMSGLKSTRCPECGSEYTLDALIAAQPNLAQAEVER